MTRHTPARLRYEASTRTLRADPQNYAVAMEAQWLDGTPMDGAIDYPESFRRLAACYNALAGIPTEALENGAVAEIIAALQLAQGYIKPGAGMVDHKIANALAKLKTP